MDRIRFITHEDKQILLIDLTTCSAEGVMKIAGEVQRSSSICRYLGTSHDLHSLYLPLSNMPCVKAEVPTSLGTGLWTFFALIRR